ncbi:MAG TPA: hemerythrin domain-containing protein [Casimicrobiaceae bacterium]|nr:hemerythrin domain-containing protein [Casimicrobiaceae bacterium]
MAADSKTNRRSTGGRSDESDKRSSSSRGGSSAKAGRSASGGARKATASKSAAGGRKTAAKKAAGGARKTASKKTTGGRGAKSATSAGRKTAAKKASASRAGKQAGGRGRAAKSDALSLLREDHERVDGLFKKYDRMKEGDERKQALREQILEEVRVHAQVEEELFYPALRTVLEEQGKQDKTELLDEADVEHSTVKFLMAEIEGGKLESEMVDARMKVMSEYIKHHVEEEEGEIFRAAKRSDVDLEALGRQMDARKRELMGEPPMEGEGEEPVAGAMASIQGGDATARRAAPPTTH